MFKLGNRERERERERDRESERERDQFAIRIPHITKYKLSNAIKPRYYILWQMCNTHGNTRQMIIGIIASYIIQSPVSDTGINDEISVVSLSETT